MATLTIKNLPDEIYAALANMAKQHRRSINNEAIMRLEQSLGPVRKNDEEETIERIRETREKLQKKRAYG